MTVSLTELSILVVNEQLATLVAADFSRNVHCILFDVGVLDSALAATFFYIPATTGIGNNVMSFHWKLSKFDQETDSGRSPAVTIQRANRWHWLIPGALALAGYKRNTHCSTRFKPIYDCATPVAIGCNSWALDLFEDRGRSPDIKAWLPRFIKAVVSAGPVGNRC